MQGVEELPSKVDGQDLSEEHTGSSDEDDVLLEPRFKYSRILSSTPAIFATSPPSCMTVHDKFIAIGTQNGYVYILDHLGNAHPENTARHHRCPVTKISVDLMGSYFASCARDARISLYGIGSSEYTETVELKNAARSVAIAPDFGRRGSGHMFVTVERNVVLHERRFLGTYKETMVFQGMESDGFIDQVSWRVSCIAFTNDTGTRIYERTLNRIIALVQPLGDSRLLRASKVSPLHCWIDDDHLALAWANTVTVCKIVSCSEAATTGVNSADKVVEVHYTWKVDMNILGLAFTFDEAVSKPWKEIVLFGYSTESSEEDNDNQLFMQLVLLEPEGLDCYAITTEDRIEMKRCSHERLQHFQMCSLPYESLYYLLGDCELIEAHPCSPDDRVRWYLENRLYEEAMNYCNEHGSQLKELNAVDVGKKFIDQLISEGRFADAAGKLKTVCGPHKELWEYYVNEFDQNHMVLHLAKYLPVKDPQLEPESYQCVLIAALYNHIPLFHRLISVWKPELYRVGAVIDMTIKRALNDDPARPLSNTDVAALYRCLAKLYTCEKKYSKALMLYIKLNDKSIFQLIDRYQLFDMVKNDISLLMSIDADLAIRLLIENASKLPAKTVLTQISKYPKLQMAYLNRLLERSEGDEFADLAIRLYAEYDQKRLLPFLRKKQNYDIAKALKICEAKQYVNEMVFLLGRSGDRLKALNLLVYKLSRIDLAIDFCRENDDEDLWNALIDATMSDPTHITQLLNGAGDYVDPLNIITKIPSKMFIPGLHDSLMKILRDYELQLQSQNGCRLVTLGDVIASFKRYLKHCIQPYELDLRSTCVSCRTQIIKEKTPDSEPINDVIVFGCGHVIHKSCFEKVEAYNDSIKRHRGADGCDCPLCSNSS